MANKNKGVIKLTTVLGGETPIPPEFIAAMDKKVHEQQVPLDEELTPLSDTVVECALITKPTNKDEYTKRTVFKKPGNITLADVRSNDGGRPVQVTRTLYPSGQTTPPVFTATTETAIKDLGNGWSILEQSVEGTYVDGEFVPSVFDRVKYSIEIPNLIPEEFRGAIPTIGTIIDSAGAAVEPSLAGNEIYESQEQINEFKKRVETREISAPSLPVAFENEGITTDYGGGKTVNQRVYAASGTLGANEGEDILKSEVKQVSPGRIIKDTVKRDPTETTWPELIGTEVDDQYNLEIEVTEQVVDAGEVGGIEGDLFTEVKPLDKWRSKKITKSIPTSVLDSYYLQFPSKTDVQVPRELQSITAYRNGTQLSGNYSETGTFTVATMGSGGVSLRGEAHGSGFISFDLDFQIKEVWGNDVPAVHVLFFLKSPFGDAAVLTRIEDLLGISVAQWPKFTPVTCGFVCPGIKLSASLTVSANEHVNVIVDSAGVVKGSTGIRGGGSGLSNELGVNYKLVRVPPTIHPALSVGGFDTGFVSFNTQASVSAGSGRATVNTGIVVSRIGTADNPVRVSPGSVPSSGNRTTIPTTGWYLHRLRTEPYKYGYIKIDAEIVNFVNIA